MQILNIAGYKFITLNDLTVLRKHFLDLCQALQIKGTILLSQEGINISLAGSIENINKFIATLGDDARFADISFHQTYASFLPFRYLKVKLKKEIITLGKPEATPTDRAPSISPKTFQQWLDEKRDITVLDTRNNYEYQFGTFDGAINPQIDDFGEFPDAIKAIEKDKPIVMFCTGGIRCEKAAVYMMSQGYNDVYQLDGGILGYFKEVGGAHYKGECFVFDDRVSVDHRLEHIETKQCRACHGPVTREQQQSADYIPDVSCPACANKSAA